MSIRLKLLLLGLATLLLPWAGCRYAREMESALREGEQNSLLSVAQTIASSLQGRSDLLYREPVRVQEPDTPGADSGAGAATRDTTATATGDAAAATSRDTGA